MQAVWWFGAAITLAVTELVTLELTFLMLAGGAAVAGVAALIGAPLWLAIILFLAAALLFLFAVRPVLMIRMGKGGDPDALSNASALVGREAKTLTVVTEDGGRVKLAGEVWTARTENDAPKIKEGVEVNVLEISGATAVVAPVEK